jgi:5-methylcytosine-specific restriction endonuclease McrA
MLTKVCSKCGEELAATTEFFNAAKRGLHGLRPECKTCSAIWRKNNKDRIKEYYLQDKENYIKKATGWNKNNPERRKEICKNDYKNNLERFIFHCKKRRARLHGLSEFHTKTDIDELYEEQEGHCFYCGTILNNYHVDHKTPLSRGGSDTKENLCLACPNCNWIKNSKTEEEFYMYLLREN